ncbi:MAG TPA: 16S rRNA (cytidine(1402)-2'-O)-methyltransferase [Flavobacteriia bacterium]|jgi:16S rRNA (cytidine1402-2'-O)-methyltransferase|nr:16S rRNA (cytidine(1402)-2'-O)-methyltransferase [Flavobacteriia bacterium]
MEGKLYIVPTPIGNLQDMTFRAIAVLKNADLILAEDTRTSGKLLKHFDIDTPQRSFHKFNEHKIVNQLVEQMQQGQTFALISDAGTPAISDPGYLIVHKAIEQNIPVETLPGATAFVPALVNSGLPAERFVFEGFLPVKKGRKTRLESLENEARTMIFYESPHKLLKTLKDFETYFGPDRQVSVSREISKLYEETIRGTLQEVREKFEQKPSIKGEFVIVLQGQKNK